MPSLIFVLIAPILYSSFSSSVLVQLVLWNYIRKCKTTLKIVKIICVCSYITDLAPQVGFEPTAYRLTAERSTTELLGNIKLFFERPAVNRYGLIPLTLHTQDFVLGDHPRSFRLKLLGNINCTRIF